MPEKAVRRLPFAWLVLPSFKDMFFTAGVPAEQQISWAPADGCRLGKRDQNKTVYSAHQAVDAADVGLVLQRRVKRSRR